MLLVPDFLFVLLLHNFSTMPKPHLQRDPLIGLVVFPSTLIFGICTERRVNLLPLFGAEEDEIFILILYLIRGKLDLTPSKSFFIIASTVSSIRSARYVQAPSQSLSPLER